jgi:hypothetical protein
MRAHEELFSVQYRSGGYWALNPEGQPEMVTEGHTRREHPYLPENGQSQRITDSQHINQIEEIAMVLVYPNGAESRVHYMTTLGDPPPRYVSVQNNGRMIVNNDLREHPAEVDLFGYSHPASSRDYIYYQIEIKRPEPRIPVSQIPLKRAIEL